ncbi:MAG: FAD-dependent oxidoreductase [Deltaproteobacteria bacterium]|nr:FAD-dependent oxidoreductase [Deltaproteobacteria bacterium]
MPPVFSREIERPLISNTRPKEQTRTSPCESVCPAGNPIQKVHGLVKEKRYEEALEFLRARNPFPGTTGRICTHPCETDCNRREWDEAINIRGLERAAAEGADGTLVRKPARMERSGRKIAVIGGGPAGLTFAYFSSLLGHAVTIFEAGPTLGGIPRLCVPEYRLPKDVLDQEIGLVLETGVKARTNTRIGREISFAEVRASADAVLIATGTWQERRLDLPHAEKALKGVEFLRRVNLGVAREIGRTVVILGGGGVAFDCAFTARRLGGQEVHILCLEGADCMAAPADDLAQAKQEGIIVHNGCMASRILAKEGKVTGVACREIAGFCFDEKGEACVEETGEPEKILTADTVILAAGVKPDLDFVAGEGIALNPNGTLKVDPLTGATSLAGVFAAGDAATGPSIVARAVGQGRTAALAVHRFLTGDPKTEEALTIGSDSQIRSEAATGHGEPHVVCFAEMLNPDYYEKRPRQEGLRSAQISFAERNAGLDGSAAAEAERCLHCGHCHKCGKCVEDCPGLILVMAERGPEVRYADECWHCGNCRTSCPDSAVSYVFPLYTLV